jgi:hypothetical protein
MPGAHTLQYYKDEVARTRDRLFKLQRKKRLSSTWYASRLEAEEALLRVEKARIQMKLDGGPTVPVLMCAEKLSYNKQVTIKALWDKADAKYDAEIARLTRYMNVCNTSILSLEPVSNDETGEGDTPAA